MSPNGSYATEHAHTNGGKHDTKDIRLPNHTAVVSHIAVDVRALIPLPLPIQRREERGNMLTRSIDRRLPSQARLLLPRTTLPRTGRQAELHELRNRSNR